MKHRKDPRLETCGQIFQGESHSTARECFSAFVHHLLEVKRGKESEEPDQSNQINQYQSRPRKQLFSPGRYFLSKSFL